MKKKLCLLLSLFFIFGLVGCGKEYSEVQQKYIADMEEIINTLEKVNNEDFKIGKVLSKIYDSFQIKGVTDIPVNEMEEKGLDEKYKNELEAWDKVYEAYDRYSNISDMEERAKRTILDIKEILKEYKENIE